MFSLEDLPYIAREQRVCYYVRKIQAFVTLFNMLCKLRGLEKYMRIVCPSLIEDVVKSQFFATVVDDGHL